MTTPLLYNVFFSFLFATQLCPKNPIENQKFNKLEIQIEKKVRTASNLVTIAAEADAVLSKLLTNKSPVLINWINKRNLMSAKEEVIAGEWRYYYLNHFVLSKYPTPKPKVNTSVEKLFSDINAFAFPQKKKDSLLKVFEQARLDSIARVSSFSMDEKTKAEILGRIKKIKLYWFQKLKGSRYQNKPLEYLNWGLAYDPVFNEINVGLHTLKYIDDDSLYSVFAHEIGHAFDPCRWSAFFKTKSPFAKLTACLRDKQSAGALKRDDSKMSLILEKKVLSPDMAQSLKDNLTCNRSFYPPTGTQKEQILEVFADWFSAEVMAHSSRKFKSLRPDLCTASQLSSGSSYLPNQERLKRIYYTHPLLQSQFNLKSPYKYCSFK